MVIFGLGGVFVTGKIMKYVGVYIGDPTNFGTTMSEKTGGISRNLVGNHCTGLLELK